jgi:hypothetical protein
VVNCGANVIDVPLDSGTDHSLAVIIPHATSPWHYTMMFSHPPSPEPIEKYWREVGDDRCDTYPILQQEADEGAQAPAGLVVVDGLPSVLLPIGHDHRNDLGILGGLRRQRSLLCHPGVEGGLSVV